MVMLASDPRTEPEPVREPCVRESTKGEPPKQDSPLYLTGENSHFLSTQSKFG